MGMYDTGMNDAVKEEEKKSNTVTIPPTLQRVLPRVIPGAISPQNKDAIDWAWQGFIAFGAQTTVVIVDPVTLQCAQTLSKHRTHVSKLKWRKTHHYHQLSAPNTLVLASADISGIIYIWNIVKGEVIATLQDGNRPIQELEWLGEQDGSEYLLAALHPPYSAILWDTRHGSKVWKKSYTETLLSFSFDPFHFNKMAFLCQGCVLFIDDFSIAKTPSSNGNRFFISAPTQSPTRSNLPSTLDDKEKGSNTLKRKVRELVAGPGEAKSKNNEDGTQLTECLQLLYHQTVHDQLILLYQREVLILDLTINQTIGVIAIDRTMSPLTQVISCWQRDVLFCLHESGSVSGHFRRHFQVSSHNKDQNLSAREDNEQLHDVVYERKCYSEPLRLSKSNRPLGFALNPVTEKQIALVLGDGRIVFKELNVAFHSMGMDSGILHHTQTTNEGVSHSPRKVDSSPELNIRDNHFSPELTTGPYLNIPVLSLSQIVQPPYEGKDGNKDLNYADGNTLRLIMTGLMTSLASPPLVIRMCPPLTTRNLNYYMPLLAVGTQGGSVQVLNLATGVVEREFSLHTYAVRGLEWTSLTSFLSFGNQQLTNSQGRVRNELIHTDTRTGYSITLRGNKTEESPIEMIRVSYLKQYFIVILKDDPFELWDCQTLTPLRTMPRRFPKVSALEWSPTTHIKSRKESLSSDSQKEEGQSNEKDIKVNSGDDLISTAMKVAANISPCDGGEKSIIKENLVFTDGEGQLYRFSVEGNVIKDGNKNPPDPQLNTITYIARKSNDIVLGDSDGTLAVLDLKSRTSRHINTHRGWVKKMRFAPGKDNMKLLVLYADGVDIWDIREVILVSELKSPKSIVKVLDIDWGASDRPVLATVDGCLRVMDIHLKACCSPVNQYYTKDSIVSPYLLTSENALNVRTMMIHQPWKSKYSLLFSEEDGFDSGQINEVNVWLSRMSPDIREYMENCNSVAHRALVSAYLFGDQGELMFWTVATYYLMMLSRKPATDNVEEKEAIEKCENVSSDEFLKTPDCSVHNTILRAPQLDSSFYHLCDNYVYKSHELERLFLHERKEVSGNLREDLGRRLAVIGERDRVVRLLLDADPSNDKFYPDCLRACLLSATHHSTQAQSTIKLVATNLIAAGNIWEGIELLCIIGKASDACRYLQSYGYWDDSIWLAKCVLPSDEASDLVKRWALHLISCGKKDMGVCTLISIGAIPSALEQLVQQQHHQRAALLLDAARQLNIVTETTVNSRQSESDSSNSPVSSILSGVPENIYRKYILYLFGFGNKKAVLHFCFELGELGKELLKELEAL